MPMHLADMPSAPDPLDELTRLELLVAKRADELWRLTGGERPDRELWQQAEAEVWASGRDSRRRGGERRVPAPQ
jgi:hypothetical protein